MRAAPPLDSRPFFSCGFGYFLRAGLTAGTTMKDPKIVAALILAVALVASVVIVMAPVYDCIYRDGAPPYICLHGVPGARY